MKFNLVYGELTGIVFKFSVCGNKMEMGICICANVFVV